jgi:hypothetical protein
MPGTRKALTDGGISVAAAGALVSAYETDPKQFAQAEEILVSAARRLSVRELRVVIDRWTALADAASAEDAASAQEIRASATLRIANARWDGAGRR